MGTTRIALRVALLAGAAVALVLAATTLREKRHVAIATVDEIEAQLAALDPATRAAVLARLSKDAAHYVRDKH